MKFNAESAETQGLSKGHNRLRRLDSRSESVAALQQKQRCNVGMTHNEISGLVVDAAFEALEGVNYLQSPFIGSFIWWAGGSSCLGLDRLPGKGRSIILCT